MMVEFSQHVKTDFLANAEAIMTERNLLAGVMGLEGYTSRQVGYIFQDDPRHWIVCSHQPDHGAAGRFRVSSMPKRHYTFENARQVLGRALDS